MLVPNLPWTLTFLITGFCIRRSDTVKCTSNADCTAKEVCYHRVCTDACKLYDCGPNSNCHGENHKPQCMCNPGYKAVVDQNHKYVCVPVSATDSNGFLGLCTDCSDCKTNEACVNGRCVNPCTITNCGPNSECKVVLHKLKCDCKYGFERGKDGGCKPINPESMTCSKNKHCPSNKVCLNGVCTDVCKLANCGPNTGCAATNRLAQCRPTQEELKKCSKNEECPTNQLCLNGVCTDACKLANCGQNTGCAAINHEAECRPTEVGKQCSINEDCPTTKNCTNGVCTDVCKEVSCGPNTGCVAVNHVAECKSVQEVTYEDSPRGCKTQAECKLTEVCVANACANPCTFVKCGTNKVCYSDNHAADCQCKPGFEMDKRGNCVPKGTEPKKCSKPTDCSPKEACYNGICVDPCKYTNCGPNSVCVYVNPTITCKCKPGFVRDAGGGCTRTGSTCSTQNDCKQDESCVDTKCVNICKGFQCPPGQVCKAENHRGACVAGGSPATCSTSNDCKQDETCVEGNCVNICKGYQCPPGLMCIAENHRGACVPAGPRSSLEGAGVTVYKDWASEKLF